MFAEILKYACISGWPLMNIVWRTDRLILKSDWTKNGFIVVVEAQCTGLALGPGRRQLGKLNIRQQIYKGYTGGQPFKKTAKIKGLLKCQGKFWMWVLVVLVFC